jgi:hypothetical protein
MRVCLSVSMTMPAPWHAVTTWAHGQDACPDDWGKAESLVPPASLRCWGRASTTGSCIGDFTAQGFAGVASKVTCPAGSQLKEDAATITSRDPGAPRGYHTSAFALR